MKVSFKVDGKVSFVGVCKALNAVLVNVMLVICIAGVFNL